MRIDPEKKVTYTRTERTRSRKSSGSPPAEIPPRLADVASLGQVQAMVEEMVALPETREEIVLLGQRLAQDPSYPPPAVVEEMAKILARAIKP